MSQWPHLQDIADDICPGDIDIADEVHLLIGLDQPEVLAPREVRCGSPVEPYATLTGLGWTFNGAISEGHTAFSANFSQADSINQSINLPNNYQVAKHRLDLLGKRLAKEPELKQRYTESIHFLLQKGYAEEVSDTNGIDGAVWYLYGISDQKNVA